jgi:acyl-coenzyme A thioesterase PaaI-like protein
MEFDENKRIGGSKFMFGDQPGGFGAKFYADGEGGIIGKVIMDDSKEGPPGHAHGGALAALVDEVMGASAWHAGHRVLAVSLSFSLKSAVPLHTEVILRGRVDRKEGRKVFASGELLLPDGRIAIEGTGVFVEAPQLVGIDGYNPFGLLNKS